MQVLVVGQQEGEIRAGSTLDRSLLSVVDALAKKVVLCSPTTLFAVLGVVRQAMDTFAVERQTGEILDALAGFGAQWSKFSEQVDKVEKHLGTLNNSFNDLAGPRRNQLERQLGKLDAIRSRSIDDEVIESSATDALPSGDDAVSILRDVTDRSAS